MSYYASDLLSVIQLKINCTYGSFKLLPRNIFINVNSYQINRKFKVRMCAYLGSRQKPIRVETCNARSQRLNIQFCQVPYLETKRVCTRVLYTRNGTRNSIFGFSVTYLNSDLNAIHFLQELKKFVKCIQLKFYRQKKKTEVLQGLTE